MIGTKRRTMRSSKHRLGPSGRMQKIGKRTKMHALFDAVSEMTGAYRLAALGRRSIIALTAKVKTPSRLHLGTGVSVQRGSIVHCGGKTWSGGQGHVRLCDGVAIGPYCILYGAGGIDVDEHVHFGPGVKLMSQSGQHDAKRLGPDPTYNLAPIRIGAGSWIGAGAVILGGTTLGRCVNVAPNSVVAGSVPDYAVVVGNPGRVVMKNEVLK